VRAAAATENACPQFAQKAAPSAITEPHLEQNTVSPCWLLVFPDKRAGIEAKSYF
jgi:hypothetical protein